MASTSTRFPFAACLFAGAAGLAASFAEHRLLFSPAGAYGAPLHANFMGMDPARLWLGHFLGIFVIPAYVVGYAGVWAGLGERAGALRHAMLALAIWAVCLGEVWFGFRAPIGFAVLAGDPSAVARLSDLSEPLLGATRAAIIGSSLCLAWAIGRSRSALAPNLLWANPLTFIAAVVLSYFAAPGVGRHLLPAAMNVAHGAFFLVLAWAFRPGAGDHPTDTGPRRSRRSPAKRR